MGFFTKRPKITSGVSALDELHLISASGDRERFHSALWAGIQEIDAYLKGFKLDNADLAYTETYVNDALPRFLHTLDLIPLGGGLQVLELGANPYLFSILMRRLFTHSVTYANFFAENIYETGISEFKQSIANEATDEFYEFDSTLFNVEKASPYPYQDEAFDVVLAGEILEHLVLNPFNLFVETERILKPGGRLIVTTPNAVRLVNVAAILAGENIFDKFHHVVHGRHNREYTLAELRALVEEHGYEIERLETRDRFDYNLVDIYSVAYNGIVKMPYTKNALNELLEGQGQPVENRGDNIYLVAVKPKS